MQPFTDALVELDNIKYYYLITLMKVSTRVKIMLLRDKEDILALDRDEAPLKIQITY